MKFFHKRLWLLTFGSCGNVSAHSSIHKLIAYSPTLRFISPSLSLSCSNTSYLSITRISQWSQGQIEWRAATNAPPRRKKKKKLEKSAQDRHHVWLLRDYSYSLCYANSKSKNYHDSVPLSLTILRLSWWYLWKFDKVYRQILTFWYLFGTRFYELISSPSCGC